MKKKLLLISLFSFFFSCNIATVFSQEFQNKVNPQEKNQQVKETPSDFPNYVNTGNEKEDIERYNQAKKEWIERNPEKYLEISKSGKTKNKHARPQIEKGTEYQMTSPEKQDYIKEESHL